MSEPKAKVSESFVSKVINILDSLQIETIEQAAMRILVLENMCTVERSAIVMHLSAECAVQKVNMATIFGRFCCQLVQKEQEYIADNSYMFRDALVNKCEALFGEIIEGNGLHTEPQRLRYLGIVRFIGIIYMYKFLTAKIIEWIVSTLIKTPNDDKLIYLCELLAVIGKRIERKPANEGPDMEWYSDLSKYYQELSFIANSNQLQLQTKTRRLINELIKHRDLNWAGTVILQLGDYGPIVRKTDPQKEKVCECE